jgi:hypothetical protein
MQKFTLKKSTNLLRGIKFPNTDVSKASHGAQRPPKSVKHFVNVISQVVSRQL